MLDESSDFKYHIKTTHTQATINICEATPNPQNGKRDRFVIAYEMEPYKKDFYDFRADAQPRRVADVPTERIFIYHLVSI